MVFFDLMNHVLSFMAPAGALALWLAMAAPWLMQKTFSVKRLLGYAAINFIAGVLVLLLGLGLFGRDGKMSSYVTMALVVATCQYVCAKGWRR